MFQKKVMKVDIKWDEAQFIKNDQKQLNKLENNLK